MSALVLDHISHSQVFGFASCPRSWHYSHVLHAERERTAVPLVFGSAVHAGIAAIHEAALAGEPKPTLSFSALVAAEVTESTAPIHEPEDLDALAITGQTILDTYESPKGIIGVEQAIEVEISPDLPPVVGRIDLIRRLDNGNLAISDVKTSASKVVSDTAIVSAQLGLYDLAYPAEAHEIIVLGKQKKTPTITIQPIQPWSRERLAFQYHRIFHAMQAGVDFPVLGWHCVSCPFRDRCRRDAA